MNGYRLLEKAYKEGKIKAIGISNFEGKYLDNLLNNCEIKPQVLQCERHPYYVGKDVENVLRENNIKVMSWYPLGHGDSKLLNEDIISELATKYNKSNAQIIMKLHIQMGFIVIPGSKNINHIKDNFNIFDFQLSDEDMKKMSLLDTETRYFNQTDEVLNSFCDFELQYEV